MSPIKLAPLSELLKKKPSFIQTGNLDTFAGTMCSHTAKPSVRIKFSSIIGCRQWACSLLKYWFSKPRSASAKNTLSPGSLYRAHNCNGKQRSPNYDKRSSLYSIVKWPNEACLTCSNATNLFVYHCGLVYVFKDNVIALVGQMCKSTLYAFFEWSAENSVHTRCRIDYIIEHIMKRQQITIFSFIEDFFFLLNWFELAEVSKLCCWPPKTVGANLLSSLSRWSMNVAEIIKREDVLSLIKN